MPRAPISNKDKLAKQLVVKLDANEAKKEQIEGAQIVEEKSISQDYGEQIAKFIPAEVIAFYLPAVAAAAGFNPATVTPEGLLTALPTAEYTFVLWALFAAGIIASLGYMYISASNDLVKEKILNPRMRASVKAGLSAVAFCIWAFYLGGPFVGVNYQSTIGVLLILGFTLANPFLYNLVPFPNSNGLLSVAVNKVEKTDGEIPGTISEIEFRNRGSEKIQLGKATLYWKTGWREVPVYEIDLNDGAEANKDKTLDGKVMRFSSQKNAKTHILKIQTSGGLVQSEPIDAFTATPPKDTG